MALISLDHVDKIYPNSTRPALKDIDLHIDRGDFVFLVGASGSGKTSLLRLLLREEEATAGEIRVAGYDLRRLPNRQVPQYRRSIGMIFQDYKLLPNKTVWENVAFALEVIGTPRSAIKSLVPKVLKTVGLTGKEHNKPQELSGGEQQRVSLARALVNNPEIIIADEPTGNVDPELSHEIIELLNEINSMGTTVLVVTHEHELVREFNQRVVTIDHGKVIGDTRSGRFATGASEDYDEDDYSIDYNEYREESGYTGEREYSDDEILESYEGLGYDDDVDEAGTAEDDAPQYPDNVVIVPDDDDRLG